MPLSLKTRLKVSSVNSIQDPEGRENIRIIFVELHTRPPSIAMMPQNTPKELSGIVFQVQQGLQRVMPKELLKHRFQKVVLVFSPEELEAFNIKPYPNQVYEILIVDGALQFKKINI